MKKTLTLFFVAIVFLPQIFLLDFNASSRFSENFRNKELAGKDKQPHPSSPEGPLGELVVGVSDMPSKNYRDLLGLISKYSGKVLTNVSFKEKVEAIIASLPLSLISAFIKEAKVTAAPKYVEPNARFKIDFVPNDPYWAAQWGPQRIEADYAWNTTVGNSSVLVATIDTGIDWTHPDIAANYAPLGYDWVNNDTDPMDDNGHGTHVAGIIAGAVNNGIGIAGISQVKVMAEKGLDQNGFGYEGNLSKAIIHAVDSGARIISMSWGDYANYSLIQNSIKYAYDSGALLIAAAGNDATNQKIYPAAYDEVVAVSATDESDNPAWFSNFGDWIELAAPGVNIISTLPYNGYGYKSGTSMATPFVSGLAALILSKFPGMTRDQLRIQLRISADDKGAPGFDSYYGYGRINAERALVVHNVALTRVSPRRTIVGQGYDVIVDVNVTNRGSVFWASNVTLYANTTVIQTQQLTLAAGNFTVLTFTWNTRGFAKSSYTISAYAWPVPNEIDTADNTYTDGQIQIALPGDTNGDKKVDGKDIAIIARGFGSSAGQGRYTPNADINGDGKIDGKDIVIVAKNFGKIDS